MRLGRIGLGRVGWTPFSTRLDPSLTFFPLCRDYRAVTIVPFTVHFILQHELLEQAMFSLDKLSKKNDNNNEAVMQNTSHYYRYLLRVSCGATYYEKGIES